MTMNATMFVITLNDFEDQLEVNGIDVAELTADEVAELRDAYSSGPEAEWKRFESIAIVAESFARSRRNEASSPSLREDSRSQAVPRQRRDTCGHVVRDGVESSR
jgi:hypothetical protein